MGLSGPLHSLQTASYMRQAQKTELSKCGKTARAITGSGVVERVGMGMGMEMELNDLLSRMAHRIMVLCPP